MKKNYKYILNDNTKVLFLAHDIILLQNHNTKKKVTINHEFYIKIVKWLEQSRYIDNLGETFNATEIDFLKKNKIIKNVSPVLSKYIGTRYENYQIYLENIYKDAEKKDYINLISKNKVLFIGAGGICTSIVDYLISVGINKLGLVDFDKVEFSNLNRQYKYSESDINKNKVDVLKNNLIHQYSNLEIDTYDKKITCEDDLISIVKKFNPSFIICAADTPIYKIQYYIASVCMKHNIPCIFGGVGETKGTYGPLLYRKNAYKSYLKEINDITKRVDYLFPCKGSYGITNSLISTYMASDVINFLICSLKN